MYSYGPPHMAGQKQDVQLEHTYSSYVRIRDVALKTCQRRWTIGKSGERGSGISVLTARHDDDDDDVIILANTEIVFWRLVLNGWNKTFFLYLIFTEDDINISHSLKIQIIWKDCTQLTKNGIKKHQNIWY